MSVLSNPGGRYALGLAIFSIALALREWIFANDSGLPFLTFYPAVTVATLLCGYGPGSLVLLLGGFAGYHIALSPSRLVTFTYVELVSVAIYLFSGALTVLIIEAYSRAREELQSRLVAIVESSSDAIIGQTLDGVITSWNPAAQELLGYAPDEIIGEKVNKLLLPRQLPEEMARLHTLAKGHRLPPIDTIRVHKDGSEIDLSLALSPVRNEQNQVVGISKIARDIRTRRKLDAELLRAKEMAEKAAASKSEFLANMSHEIRTPMNAVLGLAHLLAHTPLNDEQQDYVTKISSSGRILLGILNDVLDFSKIDANFLRLEETTFQIAAIFNDLSSIMSINGAMKNLELAVAIDPAIPLWVIGDPIRLQQVLINLSGNAIKFTERGEVVVQAKLAKRAAGKAFVCFTVQDTGIGMTDAQKLRLFEPFSQADASTTRRFGGTGLGLAICKRLVELMGGNITVDSAPGLGSTFSFTIAFAEVPDAASAHPVTSLDPLHVLVVDDSAIARTALAMNIGSLGWQSDIVGSGDAALVRLSLPLDKPYDVVLIDWQMPGMDGLETSRRIRQNLQADELPIIIMVSAFVRDEALHSKAQGQVDAVLSKPVTASMLYDTLAEAIARRRGNKECALPENVMDGKPRLVGLRVLLVEDNVINQRVARTILEKEGGIVTVVDDGQAAVDWLSTRRQEVNIVLMDVQMPGMDGVEAPR